MKKLLYTLFAFALVIVACEKDMDESYNVDSISPIEASVEEIDIESRFEAFNDLISGIEIPKTTTPSTRRGGDNGTNWIEVTWFTHTDGGRYVYLRPEDLGNGCYPDAADEETYTLLPGNRLNIQVETATGTASNTFGLPASLVSRYNGAFGGATASVFNAQASANRVVFGAIPSITVAFECTTTAPSVWEEDSATRGLFSLEGVGSYQLDPAPFPLTGFLATMRTNTSGHTVRNYAGTTSSSVHDEIRGDFAGN